MKQLFTYGYWLSAVGLLAISPEAWGQYPLFQPAQTVSLGAYPQSMAVGDLNKDGEPDLITANKVNTSVVLLGDGQGGFAPAYPPYVAHYLFLSYF